MATVLLDLMGTVLVDPYREALSAATGQDLATVRARRDPDAWPAFERGVIDEATFARRFFRDGSVFDLSTFHRVRRAGYRYLPGMRELVRDLAAVAELHIASNYPPWLDELAARFAFARTFDGVWGSCHLGVRKPDPAFFTELLSRAGVEASEALFVDDRAENCAAAADCGLAVHRFRDAATLRRHVVDLGLLPRESTR